MNGLRIFTALQMILRMLVRRRIVLLALGIIPLVFLTGVELTASDRLLPFRLASLDAHILIRETQKSIALVFFSVANTGFLVSFMALNLMQVDHEVNRRLVICGYNPLELLTANLMALILVIAAIALYIGTLVQFFVTVEHRFLFITGLLLIGFVYGCYGMVIGSLIRGKLEGVLLVFLLANIDVGWLQNPTYYAEAHNNIIIRYLPAYYPAQAAVIASFTDYAVAAAALYSVCIGTGLLMISMGIFYAKMRLKI
jgi:hypothetical protein